MATPFEEAELPDNLQLGVEINAEYVLGLPILAALTLSVRPDGGPVEFVELPSPFSLVGRIGVSIRDAAGALVHEFLPQVNMDFDHDSPGLTLEPGDAYRLLIDLSPLVPATLSPGVYAFEVYYLSVLESASAIVSGVTLREPTANEDVWRALVAAQVERVGSWGAWASTDSGSALMVSPLPQPPEPATFHTAVWLLAWAVDPAVRHDPALIQSVTGVAQPEAELIRSELLDARGARQEAEAIRAAIDTSHPSLHWLTEATRRGFGTLNQLRPQ